MQSGVSLVVEGTMRVSGSSFFFIVCSRLEGRNLEFHEAQVPYARVRVVWSNS